MQRVSKKQLKAISLVSALLCGGVQASEVTVAFHLPQLAVAKYQRPFVAVWVEQKGKRKALGTISVWYDDKKWLKDIRRWWRKAGRYDQNLDAVTGATKPPGHYVLKWDGKDNDGVQLEGEYTLYLEAVREHGNRTLLKQKVTLGKGKAQTYELDAGDELGPVNIQVGEK